MIIGDANLCEVATYLKVGTTALVLELIEERAFTRDLSVERPVDAPARRLARPDPDDQR